jgi:hypothetical protein
LWAGARPESSLGGHNLFLIVTVVCHCLSLLITARVRDGSVLKDVKWRLEVQHEKKGVPSPAPWKIVYTFTEQEYFPTDFESANFAVYKQPGDCSGTTLLSVLSTFGSSPTSDQDAFHRARKDCVRYLDLIFWQMTSCISEDGVPHLVRGRLLALANGGIELSIGLLFKQNHLMVLVSRSCGKPNFRPFPQLMTIGEESK